jgi:flavin-binding protein dodecin
MSVIKTIAAAQALAEAGKTLRGIEGMDVLETSAIVDGDKIKEYHTHVRIKFRIER